MDVSNSPFIAQIVQNKTLMGLHVGLIRFGVPVETSIFFLNQPIIREYVKLLSGKGTQWLYDNRNINEIIRKFPIQAKNSFIDFDTTDKGLLSNIKKYYANPDSFTIEDNRAQVSILNEFLKLSVYTQGLTDIMIGSSYDNSRISDPSMRQLMERRTDKAVNETMFSGVYEIFNDSFIGTSMIYTGEASDILNKKLLCNLYIPYIWNYKKNSIPNSRVKGFIYREIQKNCK